MKRIAIFLLTFIVTAPLIWGAVVLGYYLVVEEWRLIQVSSLEGANAMGVLFMIAPACAVIVATILGIALARRAR